MNLLDVNPNAEGLPAWLRRAAQEAHERRRFRAGLPRYLSSLQVGEVDSARDWLLSFEKSGSDFNADNAFGKLGEWALLWWLKQKHGHEAVELPADGFKPEYDLQTRKGAYGFTYEVKTDMRAHQTGNVAVELNKRRGEPSGLSVTKADWFVFYEPHADAFYLAKTEALRAYTLRP